MGSKKFENTHLRHNFDLKNPGHISDGENSPPRISEAVMHATPSKVVTPPLSLGNYRATMKRIFEVVHGRLKGGLDDAWKSTWGYDVDDMANTPEVNKSDERWARLVSEMFVFTAYQGPGLAYGIKTKHLTAAGLKPYVLKKGHVPDYDEVTPDMFIFQRLDISGEGKEDPAYSIVGACQHVATYMVMARGYSAAALGPSGLGVGDNSDRPCFKPEWGGAWKPLTNGSMATLKANLGEDGGLTPGSMFGFVGSPHIGGVLRYDPGADQFQPMDTGVLATGTDVGTADHEAKSGANGSPKTLLVGVGILSGLPPTEQWLAALPTARPLGFAHLVVADANNRLRYISRALPMYEQQQGYAITRYVWSLRCFPADGYGFWIISIPADGDVSAALLQKGARGKSLRDLCQGICGTKNGTALKPVNIIISTRGAPDQGRLDEGMVDKGMQKGAKPPFWLGYANGALVYRWKSDADYNDWISYRGHSQTHDNTALFTTELTSLTVVEGKSFSSLWKSMEVDAEYTCEDPSAATNVQATDLTAGIPYFGGAATGPVPPVGQGPSSTPKQ